MREGVYTSSQEKATSPGIIRGILSGPTAVGGGLVEVNSTPRRLTPFFPVGPDTWVGSTNGQYTGTWGRESVATGDERFESSPSPPDIGS